MEGEGEGEGGGRMIGPFNFYYFSSLPILSSHTLIKEAANTHLSASAIWQENVI